MKDMTGVAIQRFFTCFEERLRCSHTFTSLKCKNQLFYKQNQIYRLPVVSKQSRFDASLFSRGVNSLTSLTYLFTPKLYLK